VSALQTDLKGYSIAEYGKEASQWGSPGFQILSQAHTRPKHGGPDPKPTRPEKAGASPTAQTIQVQGLSQFYLKISIISTLVVE